MKTILTNTPHSGLMSFRLSTSCSMVGVRPGLFNAVDSERSGSLFDACESGTVAVLAEGVGLLCLEDVEGEAAQAAKRFFRKLLRGLRYVPRVIVTDQLRSYAAAKREILPGVEHRQSRNLDNRAEVSHQPTRRERQMQRFKSARHAQCFPSTHSRIHNHFQLRRHYLTDGVRSTIRARFALPPLGRRRPVPALDPAASG